MPQKGPVRWLDGEGWLVLLGGGDWRSGETDQVDAQLLSVANLDRPMIVLIGGGRSSEAEAILDHYTQMGGPGGDAFALSEFADSASSYRQLDAPEVLTLIQEAGIIYLGGEDPIALVANLHESLALRHIVEGYSTLQALTLIGVGAGAAALGRWVFTTEPPHQQAIGLGFVMNAVVVPHFTATENSPILRALPQIGDNLLGLGIPNKTAMALGPQEQLEMWGEGQVTAVVNAGDSTP
jgi:hypothetical protein